METIESFIRNWSYVQGQSALVPFGAVAIYFLVIFGGQALVRLLRLPAFKLHSLLALHNFVLMVASIIMFYGLFTTSLQEIQKNGLDPTLCRPTGGKLGQVWFWCWVFYLSKFYELLDTVFLVLRQRPLTFLHVFHHASVVPVFWLLLEADATNMWLPAMLNSGVHIPMYYYFMCESSAEDSILRSLPSLRPLKRFITMTQIFQFYVDVLLIFTIDVTFPQCRARVYDLMTRDAAGPFKIAAFFLLPVILIVLFSRFYRTSYGTKDSKRAKAA